MWLLFGIAFGTFAGVLASFDKQSKGSQFITGAILLATLALFIFCFVNPSAVMPVMRGIHSATGI